jgi:hypothetical protein
MYKTPHLSQTIYILPNMHRGRNSYHIPALRWKGVVAASSPQIAVVLQEYRTIAEARCRRRRRRHSPARKLRKSAIGNDYGLRSRGEADEKGSEWKCCF